MLKLSLQFFAHKKGVGSTKNGRDSEAKRLGVKKSDGQAVKAGDVLMILEAMKMENDISAPCDGTVKQILVTKGSTVNTDDILIVI